MESASLDRGFWKSFLKHCHGVSISKTMIMVVGPKFKFYLLDFFCSGIQFYLLLSPYLCFISLLYLDLYVLGDDALIS